MFGPQFKRFACIFAAVVIVGPSFDHFGKLLTDNTILRLVFAGIGGALGLFVGLAVENYLFGRKRLD